MHIIRVDVKGVWIMINVALFCPSLVNYDENKENVISTYLFSLQPMKWSFQRIKTWHAFKFKSKWKQYI